MATDKLRTGHVRPEETATDPRHRLVREKFFSMRPRPLERWLWAQDLAPAAERVFWFHWDEGHRAGDWCSQVPIRQVALACHLDPATVTRAYQALRKLGLIRREDPGRDPHNPFCQATAVTEVRLPPAVVAALGTTPNRGRAAAAAGVAAEVPGDLVPVKDHPGAAFAVESESPASNFNALKIVQPTGLKEARALFQKLSAAERQRYQEAQRLRATGLEFDADTRLTAEERAYFLNSLSALHAQPAVERVKSVREARGMDSAARRPLTPLELARIRRRVLEQVPGEGGAELARQVAWSVEAGALSRFGAVHGLHIALKKIREGAWTRPNRMPPNWLRATVPPETCGAA
jgi:hypothetical protein